MNTPFRETDLFSYQTINEVNCVPALEIAACSVESVNEAEDSTLCDMGCSARWVSAMAIHRWLY
jgi:hypothetical protein